MENVSPENQLLKHKYDLHKQPEVDAAARHTLAHTGEKVPQDPLIRIQNYLDRLDNVFNPPQLENHPDFDRQQRNLALLKPALFDKFITKVKDIPDSYWKTQERLIRERGQQGDYEQFSEAEKLKWKKDLAEGLLSDQRASFEQWIDYLASPSSSEIPNSIKYWVFRSVVDMQEYDKEAQDFPKRSKGTVKMFPDINEEALGYVANAIVAKYKGEGFDFGQFDFDLTDESKQRFKQNLDAENFSKLYAWANEYIQPISTSELLITEGQWIMYPQDTNSTDNYKRLSQSIRGKGTGWCTAGENTAKIQLKGGDFYVYYSNDAKGNPVNPRIAIRMEDFDIAEIRGIGSKQNLDPYMNDVLAEKLGEFPDKDEYLKKEADMRYLTEIDNKVKAGEVLGRDDLVFLYELNSPIEGFGNEDLGVSSDPRIKELRDARSPDQDMLVIFNCELSQIARNANQINEDTKVYFGPLETGIFKILQKYGIEHIYTEFPGESIRIEDLEIGGKDSSQLQRELNENGITTSPISEFMMRSHDFTTLQEPQNISLVTLKVSDLGFTGYSIPAADGVYKKAQELGLDLCPAEVGPRLQLKYKDQPMTDYDFVQVRMTPIADSDGRLHTFFLRDNYLHDSWGKETEIFYIEEDKLVFSLPK